MASPSGPLFSAWNWVATMFSRPTIEQTLGSRVMTEADRGPSSNATSPFPASA